ncbi:MAG: energy transducer TonB [Bacteroidetes bacterium]|nr:MAG: energy transducer TonB [Bacteroidota bacterium]
MIAKKNPRYDLERKRLVFFQTGLLIAGAFTLAAFAWRTPMSKEVQSAKVTKDFIPIYELSEKPEKVLEKKSKTSASNDQKKQEELDSQSQVNELTQQKKNEQSSKQKSNVGVVTRLRTGSKNLLSMVGQPNLKPDSIHDFVDRSPQFQGGFEAWVDFYKKNLRYPEAAIVNGEQGKVYVSFVIEKDGDVSHVKLERGVSEDLNREALRLVSSMPDWLPGEFKGKRVRTRMRLPVNFKLD